MSGENVNELEARRELLLRHVDGRASDEEGSKVQAWLRTDPAARAFLREVAEQAVMIADIERTRSVRQPELHGTSRAQSDIRNPKAGGNKLIQFETLKWALPLAAMLMLLFGAVFYTLSTGPAMEVAVIRGMGGKSIEWIGPNGQLVQDLKVGDALKAGMDVRTVSENAWLQLELRGGSTIIVTSQSRFTTYESEAGGVALRLLDGNLWGTAKGAPLPITTPTAVFTGKDAQFHIETGQTSSILRVYEGVVGAVRLADWKQVDVAADAQVSVSLNNPQTLLAVRQPDPVNYWNCGMLECPDAVVGVWARGSVREPVRLKAKPVPIGQRDGAPRTIYLSLFRVASSGSPSVLLETDSVIRVRGRTSADAKVRFGVSTQKMRGLFSGKYRTRLDETLERAEDGSWTVELPVAEMGLLDENESFSKSPIGSELNSIMVYTVDHDVELEIHQVELLPRSTRK